MNAAVSIPTGTSRFRRNDYDVTNTVQVSSTESVKAAVTALFQDEWPAVSTEQIARTFDTLDALFSGRLPGFHGVDTVYHDRQHTLDVTLAAARLMVGYERTIAPEARLGGDRALMGLVTAAFHDAGYVREIGDPMPNGARYTSSHVSRSARLLERFLPAVGLQDWASIAGRIVHYTGYEVPFKDIQAPDERDHRIGYLVGTADLIAQMADRCYLEKCRDRLYPEFVLAGVATGRNAEGYVDTRYGSGLDLLRKTPIFVETMRRDRLDGAFQGAYHYLEALFEGRNPYIEAIDQHMAFLRKILRSGNFGLLRRNPPVFTRDPDPLPGVRQLVVSHIKGVWSET
ncbi:MAG: hypothetical protein WCP04_03300 [Pseudomonadota bacterium]|jgi:hypothetical protein